MIVWFRRFWWALGFVLNARRRGYRRYVRYYDVRAGHDVIVFERDDVGSRTPAALVPEGKDGQENISNQRTADAD